VEIRAFNYLSVCPQDSAPKRGKEIRYNLMSDIYSVRHTQRYVTDGSVTGFLLTALQMEL